MRHFLVLLTAIVGLSMIPVSAGEHKDGDKEDKEKKNPQTLCPVLNQKIDRDLYVDHKGQRVYVCCKGCLPEVKKHPQKYIDKLEAQGVDVEKIQTTCPVMGGKINKELYVDAKGKRIYLCCKGCVSAVEKNPDKYIEKLEKQGVTVESLKKDDAEKKGQKHAH